MFQEAGIEPAELKASAFDGPLCYLGRSLPISGGLLRAAGFHTDILENSVLVTEGKDRVLAVLKELAEGKSKAKMFDLLFCEGCINGPKIPNDHGVFARKEMLTDYINEQNRYTVRRELIETLAEFEGLDLSREFSEAAVVLPQPTEEEIAEHPHADAQVHPRGPAELRLLRLPLLPGEGHRRVPGPGRGGHVPALPGGGAGDHPGQAAAVPPGAGHHAEPARADRAPGLHGADLRRGGPRDQQPPLHDPAVLAHAAQAAPDAGPRDRGHPDDRQRGHPLPLHHARPAGLRPPVAGGEGPDRPGGPDPGGGGEPEPEGAGHGHHGVAARSRTTCRELMLDGEQIRQMLVNLVQNGMDAIQGEGRGDDQRRDRRLRRLGDPAGAGTPAAACRRR